MSKSFERCLMVKLDELKASSGADGAIGFSCEDEKVYSAPGGWCLVPQGMIVQKRHNQYEFPNKMTLKNAWLGDTGNCTNFPYLKFLIQTYV